jgi:putative ABC transport system substrate-binding protein
LAYLSRVKSLRFLVCIAALAVLAAPLAIEGQSRARPAKIGLLASATPGASAFYIEAFKQGLRNLGYIEGTTFVLEARYGEGNVERLSGLARELAGLNLDVIVAVTDPATTAVKRVTRTTPIVMVATTDPVGTGFVASLAHPGGNVTGFSNISSELVGKRLELLREVLPGLVRVAVLWNPDVRGAVLDYKESEAVARSLRLELLSAEVSSPADLDRALSAATAGHAHAMILMATNPVALSVAKSVRDVSSAPEI